MPLNRREFLHLTAEGVVVSALLSPLRALAATQSQFKAVAFDAFPIFDPRPVFGLAETLFPGKGTELSNAWRTRQFEYQWLRALAGCYADFWQTTEDGLIFAAKLLKLELTPEKRAQLMQAYLGLKVWPEVPSALRSLQDAGVRLAFLSNMTAKMLEVGIENAGLEGVFEHVLSTDQIRATNLILGRIRWRSTRLSLRARKFSLRRLRVGMRLGPSGLGIQRFGSIVSISQEKSWG